MWSLIIISLVNNKVLLVFVYKVSTDLFYKIKIMRSLGKPKKGQGIIGSDLRTDKKGKFIY